LAGVGAFRGRDRPGDMADCGQPLFVRLVHNREVRVPRQTVVDLDELISFAVCASTAALPVPAVETSISVFLCDR